MSEELEPEQDDALAPRLVGRVGKVRLRQPAADATQSETQSNSAASPRSKRNVEGFTQLLSTSTPTQRRGPTSIILAVWIAVIAMGFLARLNYGLEDDELQHLHMAWRIGQGQVPFRDFFELHPPLLHYLLGPFVSGYTRFSQTPFVTLRLCEAGVLILLLFAGFNVLRRLLPRSAAAFGAGIFLISSSFSYALYDIRPDWLGLFFIVAIVWLISERPSRPDESTDRTKLHRAALAGFLACLASMLTQKAWFLLAGIVAWNIGTTFFSPTRDLRRLRLRRMLMFWATAAGSTTLVLLYFAANGAAKSFINDNLLLQLHSPRERWFAGYIRATAPFSAGVLSLAALAGISAIRNWRNELASAGTRGLVAAMGIVGTIDYVLTPVPYEQSFLFLVGFWLSLMAADMCWRIIVEPQRWRHAPRWIAIIIILLAATQKNVWHAAVLAGSWLTLLAIATFACQRSIQSGRAALRVICLPLALSVSSFLAVLSADVVDLRFEDRRILQANLYEALDNRLAPREPIITLWPAALPFRPHVGFYPFAHEFIVKQYAAEIEPAYLEAMRSGQVKVVAGYEAWFAAKQMPEFAAELRRSFHPLIDVTPVDRNYNTYLRNGTD